MLFVICQNEVFARAFENCGGSVRELDYHLRTYLENYMEYRSEGDERASAFTGYAECVGCCQRDGAKQRKRCGGELSHILCALYGLEESYAVYYMRTQGVERAALLQEMNILYEEIAREGGLGENGISAGNGRTSDRQKDGADREQEKRRQGGRKQNTDWQQYAVCLNDMVDQTNPLIGREEEL